jgi:fatty acid-binding protein DegV
LQTGNLARVSAMIGICTDSSSQLPHDLADHHGIEVVPLTVTVDEHEYLEGVDIDADRIYELLAAGRRCALSVSQPSPGQFAAAYDDLVARGCTGILSVHTNAGESNMLNAARLAARSVPVPVRLVDTGTQSFGISCCAWAAAEAAAGGASMDVLGSVVEAVAGRLRHIVAVGAIAGDGGVPRIYAVFTGYGDDLQPEQCSGSADDASATMARFVEARGVQLRVGIGHGDPLAGPMADALAATLGASSAVAEVVRYRIGASLAVQTPPSAVSCFVFPGE